MFVYDCSCYVVRLVVSSLCAVFYMCSIPSKVQYYMHSTEELFLLILHVIYVVYHDIQLHIINYLESCNCPDNDHPVTCH